MEFDALLRPILALLQQEGGVSYRAIKVRFQMDDDHLEAVRGRTDMAMEPGMCPLQAHCHHRLGRRYHVINRKRLSTPAWALEP